MRQAGTSTKENPQDATERDPEAAPQAQCKGDQIRKNNSRSKKGKANWQTEEETQEGKDSQGRGKIPKRKSSKERTFKGKGEIQRICRPS